MNGIKVNTIDGLDKKNDLYGLVQFIKECDFVITIANTNAHLAACKWQNNISFITKKQKQLVDWENDYNGQNLWYPKIIKFYQRKF